MKLACFIALLLGIALGLWAFGMAIADKSASIPGHMGFDKEPPADYEGKQEPDCTVKLHLLKK